MQMYNKGLEGILDGSIDVVNDNIKIVVLDNTYTPNFTTDEFLSDVTAGAQIATSANLSNKTVTNGAFNADDVTLASVTTGKTLIAVLIFDDTGTASSSRLIGYIDDATDGVTPLSLATNGGNITVVFHSRGLFIL